MSDKTTIAWTDATWNPVTGCTKVSPGCLNCYAEALDKRFHRDGPYVPWTVAAQRKAGMSAIHLHFDRLGAPLHWKKPRRIFVNSMSDLFHEDVPDQFVDSVFAVMALAPQHVFQVLTKRPKSMLEYLTRDVVVVPNTRPASRATRIGWAAQAWGENHGIQKDIEHPWLSQYPLPRRVEEVVLGSSINDWLAWPLPNVWLGVSVENQRYADERLPLLAQCPAAVRFVSVEPMLGPVVLADACNDWLNDHDAVNWVIVGGESGPGHRPMNPAWVQDIADQCAAAGVPLFVKQDSGLLPGLQGRLSDSLWIKKELPLCLLT